MSQATYELVADSDVPRDALAAMLRAERLVERKLGLLRASYLRSFARGPVTNPREGVPVIRGPYGAGGFCCWRSSLRMPCAIVLVGFSGRDTFRLSCHELKHIHQNLTGVSWLEDIPAIESDARRFEEAMLRNFGGRYGA